jgi:hypothetical protein
MEQSHQGVICEWVADKQIVTYTLTSAKLSSLSAWSEMALKTLNHWPKDQPYRALHDLSPPGAGLVYLAAVEYDVFNIGITPGRRKEINALLAANPQWQLALAVVVSASLTGGIMQLKLLRPDPQDQRIRAKAFFDRNSALEWLLKVNQPTP